MQILPPFVSQRLASLGPLPRELAWCLLALSIGATAMPLLVWGFGQVILGDYANGGPLALWVDFIRGLLRGSLPYLALVVAPYMALWGFRLLRWIARA